jgi:hypothetical protein
LDTGYRFISTGRRLPGGVNGLTQHKAIRRQDMSTIEESIEVKAPLRTVYSALRSWSRRTAAAAAGGGKSDVPTRPEQGLP